MYQNDCVFICSTGRDRLSTHAQKGPNVQQLSNTLLVLSITSLGFPPGLVLLHTDNHFGAIN